MAYLSSRGLRGWNIRCKFKYANNCVVVANVY
jgi:hypothetical protein